MPTKMSTENPTYELQKISEEIKEIALNYNLQPFNTIFELVDYDEMNEVASYSGFPTRYPHWRFGMEFEELSKTREYGLQKIYELVINNDPCYAYLLKSNPMVIQKMVIAHVYAHSDFFRNNMWFSHTNRKMLDEMANHGTRIRKYMERYGENIVEDFIDTALSIENLINYHDLFQTHSYKKTEHEEEVEIPKVKKLKSKEYMDRFINPEEFIEMQKKKLDEQIKKKKSRFPPEPQKDVLLFLIEYAPLENWQKDILSIIREEMYYFAPQALTKIMNEGWATFWHSRIMTKNIANDVDIVDYADCHSGTVGTSPASFNPYKIGVELFRDIEDRWNKGKFGKEYSECEDVEKRKKWDKKLNYGLKKIFEVRKVYNDITFIDEFLTPEFCEQHKLFVYSYNPQLNRYEITDRNPHRVKQQLLLKLTNLGHPFIYVADANYNNRAELMLMHKHEGIDLQLDEAKDTLKNIYKLWKRPVHIETFLKDEKYIITFDGENIKEQNIH